jgi:hypothetical protein
VASGSVVAMVTASIVDIALQVQQNILDSYVELGISTLPDGNATPSVFYGDQEIIPAAVTVCVEPASKQRDWSGYSAMTDNNFNIRIIAYVEKVQDDTTTRLQCDRLAEALEHLVHSDLQLKDATGNALIIQGLVSSINFGYATRFNMLLRVATLTYAPFTKTRVTVP